MAKKEAKIKKVIKHLKGDIKDFHAEASEDKELIRSLKGSSMKKKHEKKESKAEERREHKKAPKKRLASKYENKKGKVEKVMKEYAEGKLHSGSKKGPKVRKRSQAIAIALNEGRRAGAKIPKKKK